MFGIKLKVLKRSGTVYYFRGSACEYKHIWYQIKGLYKTLRKYIIYDFIVALKWGHPDLDPKWAH